jgi:hypothetical protein
MFLVDTLEKNVIHLSGVLNLSVPTNIFKLYSSVPKPTNIFIFVGFDWEPMNLWGRRPDGAGLPIFIG